MMTSAIEAAVSTVMTSKKHVEKTRMHNRQNCALNTGLWCGMQAGSNIYTCYVPKAIIDFCQFAANFIRKSNIIWFVE